MSVLLHVRSYTKYNGCNCPSSNLGWTRSGEQFALCGDAVLLVVFYQVTERREGACSTIELKTLPTTSLCVDTKVLHCAMGL